MTDELNLLGGRVKLRPDDKGRFDELMLYDANGECLVHFEMMDRGTLWIGVYPCPDKSERISVWLRAEKGKLVVNAFED